MNLLKETLYRLQSKKVLIVGDLILDEYIWGTVERISPEAPIQILESTSEHKALGGAANVANNLRALNCEVHICGKVGDDEQGRRLIELLKEKGIHVDGVLIDPHHPTSHKVRIIGSNQQILRIDRESKQPITAGLQDMALDYLLNIIPAMDGIICSDYQKGFLVEPIFRKLVGRAHSHEISIAVDPKGPDYSRYRGVDVLTPNLHEVQQDYSTPIRDDSDLDRAVQQAFNVTQSRVILVTRGRQGMTLYENSGRRVHIPTEARDVFDITGAGDTVISVFGLGIFNNIDPADAAQLANKAAGIVVGKLGTATVNIEALASYLEGGSYQGDRKIVNLDECKYLVNAARNQGKQIVFTNGCFDLLHVGHIQYLQAARTRGDLLIVGVNSDQSVRLIKGPGRPILAEAERSKILAALSFVDYVILFSESTPERLISELRPDLLIKGDDYSIDQVVGREIVEAYGGRIELIPLVQGQSTTKIVQSIIDRFAQGIKP